VKQKPAGEQVGFLRGLVERNVLAIVEHEDGVRIESEATSARLVLTVYVMPSDMGLVLGNEGATADAIRRIVWTACKKTSLKCDIDFLTSGSGRR
jgi:predicted RNA-binding protein YlqC (UPF0109 family)